MLNWIGFLENIKEVVEVWDSNIFYPKVINNEAELDGTPFVAPEARGGFSFVITFSKKVGSKEIVGQDAGQGPGEGHISLVELKSRSNRPGLYLQASRLCPFDRILAGFVRRKLAKRHRQEKCERLKHRNAL
jgi:hypothetical protein